jgi:PAS domain S-box-containing protein
LDSSVLYQELFASSPDGILLIDPETQRVIEFNDAACRQLGYTREEFRDLRISDYEASQTPEEIDTTVQAALREGKTEFDTVQRTKTGEARHVHVWASTVDVGDRVVLYAIVRDITTRKQEEQALRRSFDLLDQTGQLARIGGWELDLETQTLHWTNEVYRIHEVDPAVKPSVAEAIQYYTPEARPVIAAAVQAAIDAGTPFDVELPLVTAHGRRIWVRALGGAEIREGKTIRVHGAFQDITARRVADESRRLQSAALHAAADAVVITDCAGVIEWVNPAFTQITGYTVEEAVGKNPRDLIRSGKHAAAFFAEFWATILAGRRWHGEVINRRKDGSLYSEDQSVTPILDASGAITHFVAIKRDITERLQLEAQFRQAQKMESVGHLASGIAHDFNNLLTVINGLSDLILEQIAQDDPVHADVQEIRHAGDRAATLTRQLLAFSRQQILAPQVMNINTVVAGMESLLRRLLDEDIDLVVVPAPGLGSVKADPGQIEQVVANLTVNARDAMPQGGRLTIETQNVTLDENFACQDGVAVTPGPYVALVVSDSGIGMDEATRARIFEPFFTTKGPGKGTGLGLATVYGIVKQSHGFICVDSEVGRGTTCKIYLPQVTEAAGADQPGPTVDSTAGTETILLVEDNAGLRKLTIRLLERAGYTVLGAATGEEALSLLERQGDSAHLLLTDVVMPGMSGRQLAEQLAQTHPGIKVLYMSGYTSDNIVRRGVLDAQVSFLGKPFTASRLLRKVREVLDS